MYSLPKLKNLLETLVIFLLLAVGVFVVSNWNSFSAETSYYLLTARRRPLAAPAPSATPVPQGTQVLIEKIGVNAPIITDVPEADVHAAMAKGVAQLHSTSQPGETGNIVLFGHSSDYVWARNPYGTVFTLVPKLQPGDKIVIIQNGEQYTYAVRKGFVTTDTDWQVVQQTAQPQLTLITCYPIGTAAKRYIIQANLVSSSLPLRERAGGQASVNLSAIRIR